MRRLLLVVCAALVLVPAAATAATPALTPSEHAQIGVLIDRFVKEAVRRENLPAAWSLIGPGLRGGTTKAGWDSGKAVTVSGYPVKGSDFRNAWTADVIGRGDVIVALMFHPDAAHPKIPQTAFKAEVIRRGGRWIVNGFYPAATFFGGGHVEGPADFSAPAGGGRTNGPGLTASGYKGRISVGSFAIGAAVAVGLLVLAPLGFWLRALRRNRRAYAAYLADQR